MATKRTPAGKPHLSLILPCYNEQDAVGYCVAAARKALRRIPHEIIVVDNNSTDRSAAVARRAGARVVRQPVPGYGAALSKGFAAARGTVLAMADADNTYPFELLPDCLRLIQGGTDMVLASRFLGRMEDGAMPPFNRYVGNPVLTGLLNLFYGCRITDTQTGMRVFTSDAYRRMKPRSTGMEYASEMIIRALNARLTIAELPASYRRRIGMSKLSPVRDAWRHVLSILLYSPTYAFIVPGMLLWLGGIALMGGLTLGAVRLGHITFGIHSLTAAIILSSVGLNIMLVGITARTYTVGHLGIGGGFLTGFVMRRVTPGTIAAAGAAMIVPAAVVLFAVASRWIASGFGQLMWERLFLTAGGVVLMGLQLVMSAFILTLVREFGD